MKRHLVPIVAAAAVAMAVRPCVCGDALDAPPVGFWRFDEAAGLDLADSSGNGHRGEILNMSRGVERVEGRNGGALAFSSGDDSAPETAGGVRLLGLGDIDWSMGLTIELWVRFTKLSRPETYELVSNTVADRGPGFRFMLTWSMLGLRSGEGGMGDTWGARSDPTDITLKTGEWYHLTGTYDGSVFRTYIDGALVGESDRGLALTRGDDVIYVGSYRGGYAYGMSGLIDDLRIYDYARSPVQIMTDARLRD